MPSLIGNRIRELRIQAGLTQTELAKDIVTPSMISQIEAGKATPSRSLLKKLAQRLDASADYLLEPPLSAQTIKARIDVIRTCIMLHRFDEAQDWIEQTLEPSAGHVEVYVLFAKVLLGQRNFREASNILSQSVKECLLQDRNDLLPEVLMLQGDLYMACSDFLLAIHVYKQAFMAIPCQVEEHARVAAEICVKLSRAYHAYGDQENAEIYEKEALNYIIFEQEGQTAADMRLTQALAALDAKEEQKAAQLAVSVRSMVEASRYVETALQAVLLAAHKHLEHGELEQAAALLERAKAYASLSVTPNLRAHLNYLQAIVLYHKNKPGDAWAKAQEALRATDAAEAGTLLALLGVSQAADKIGRPKEALTLAICAKTGAQSCTNLHVRQQTMAWLGHLYAKSGNIKRAFRTTDITLPIKDSPSGLPDVPAPDPFDQLY